MNHGDIVTVDLGAPRGHVQALVRPAIVVQDEQTTTGLGTTVVVPLTGKVEALDRFPHSVLLNPDPQNSLSQPSIMLVHQITAVDNRNIIRKIGQLSKESIELLAASLCTLLRLS